MKPIFNKNRVDETAAFIADELRTLLDRKNIDSHMNRCFRMFPVYREEKLTIGERILATLLALNMIESEVARDLGSLESDPYGEWLDEDEAA